MSLNRCAQVLADTCTGVLADFIVKSQPIHIDRLTFNSSLKYSLLNDPKISVEIKNDGGFDIFESNLGIVVPNGPAISEARLSDFLLGSMRVRKQYEAVKHQKNSGGPAAWLLVSAYYCAYFACIEMCKLINRIALSFEDDEIQLLRSKAVGPGFAKFFAAGQTNFVGSEHAGKIVFRSVGSKPHAVAWENALHAVRHVLGTKEWVDAKIYIDLLSDPECSPSRIRNTWNYRRSDYFGQIGEHRAREFRSLVGNHQGASNWLRRTAGKTGALDPCVIAVLCETLGGAVAQAGQRAGELVRQASEA